MIIDRFNDTIDVWVRALDEYDLYQLLIKPDHKTWSLGQIYIHILNDTHWYLQQIKNTVHNADHGSMEMNEGGKNLFDERSFPDIRIQGDADNAINLPQPESIAQINSGLDELRHTANLLWEELEKNAIIGKSKHPGFGYLNGYEWIQFAEMHMRHHLRQKERTDKYLKAVA